MPKKLLSKIAKEYDISMEKALELTFNNLEEDMVTGSKHLTWINEAGQDILDDIIPMPMLYRGKVLKDCPNPSYVCVYLRERCCRVNVKIPRRLRGKLAGKLIYFEEKLEGERRTYTYSKPQKKS